MIDETPEYLDLLKRAAKVRHFLAKNPGSTFAQIKEGLPGIKCPMKWLTQNGYVYRKATGRTNDPYDDFHVVYHAKPFGIPYEESALDEEVAAPAEAFRGRESDEV